MPNTAVNSALSAKIRRTLPVTVTRLGMVTVSWTTYQPFVSVLLQALSPLVTTVAVTVCVVPVSSR